MFIEIIVIAICMHKRSVLNIVDSTLCSKLSEVPRNAVTKVCEKNPSKCDIIVQIIVTTIKSKHSPEKFNRYITYPTHPKDRSPRYYYWRSRA